MAAVSADVGPLIGAVPVTGDDPGAIGTLSISSLIPGVQNGDLVVIAASSDNWDIDGGSNPRTQPDGLVPALRETEPGNAPGNGIWAFDYDSVNKSGIDFQASGASATSGYAISISVFRGFTSSGSQEARGSGTGSMPDPPSRAGVLATDLVIAAGMLDDDLVTDATAPSGYVLINSVAYEESTVGAARSTTMVAYKLPPQTPGSENPAIFGGTGSDDWVAYTARFPESP